MREFNTSGPNIPDRHYTLPRLDWVRKGKELIHKERYFTIWAPRQTGKSTYFRFLAEALQQEGYKVCAARDGFIAVIRTADGSHLVGGTRWRGGYVPSDAPATLHALAAAVFDDAVEVPPRRESLARAAIFRHLGRATALSTAGLDDAHSKTRRVVIDRLDRLMARLSLSDRSRFVSRSANIRASLTQIAGAGFDRALELRARDKQSEAKEWLTSLERIIARFKPTNERTVTAESPVVTALLLLVKDSTATTSATETKPTPSRARRSPSS